MSPRLRAGALVVLATLVVAGCAQPQAEDAGALAMAPGTKAHLLLSVGSAGDSADMLVSVRDDAGLGVTAPGRMHGDGSSAVGWLGLDVPAGTTPGDYDVVLDVEDDDGTRGVAVTVTVDEPDEPLGVGAVALLDLAFRTQDGTLAATTMGEVDQSPLPRTGDYEAPAEDAPQPVTLSEQGLPPEILWPLANASVGQSLTLELPDYFGPLSQEQHLPREEPLPRTQELPRFQEMPRAAAEEQGLVTGDTREGDLLETGGPLPYVVETLNETTLRVELDLAVGDRITVHDPWPDATVVTARDGGSVSLRTDPPGQAGDTFTWNVAWPDATEVASLNDTEIVLRHSPPEGTVYADPQQPEVEVTVAALGEDAITLSRSNPHPLAGETIFAEVTVVGEQEAPGQPAPGVVPQG